MRMMPCRHGPNARSQEITILITTVGLAQAGGHAEHEWQAILSTMVVISHTFCMVNRGGGASEQLGGQGEHAKHAPLGVGGSGGMLPKENFQNLHTQRLNLEASETKYSHQ